MGEKYVGVEADQFSCVALIKRRIAGCPAPVNPQVASLVPIEGTQPLHGGTRDPGQHQRRLGEGIGRVALLRLAEDATPAQQPENAGPDGGDEPADLRIGGRLGRMKAEAPIGCLGKDPVD